MATGCAWRLQRTGCSRACSGCAPAPRRGCLLHLGTSCRSEPYRCRPAAEFEALTLGPDCVDPTHRATPCHRSRRKGVMPRREPRPRLLGLARPARSTQLSTTRSVHRARATLARDCLRSGIPAARDTVVLSGGDRSCSVRPPLPGRPIALGPLCLKFILAVRPAECIRNDAACPRQPGSSAVSGKVLMDPLVLRILA